MHTLPILLCIICAVEAKLPIDLALYRKDPLEPQKAPGIKVRATSKALSYMNQIGTKLLSYQVGKLQIPDQNLPISAGIGSGSADITNMKITQFDGPQFWNRLKSPHNITWGTTGGSAVIDGDWALTYKALVTIRGSGSFRVMAKGIRIQMSGYITKTDDGKPHVDAFGCNALIDHLDVTVHGGLVGWLIDRFSGKIEDAIRLILHGKVCEETTKLINTRANAELSSLPSIVPISPVLTLDYRLLKSPLVATNYIESYQKGEISWRGEDHTPFNPPPIDVDADNNRMFYSWASDFVLNSLLYGAYSHDVMRFLASNETTPEIAPYLRTNCPDTGMCIGAAFYKIKKEYPNETASCFLKVLEMPYANISSGKLFLKANVSGTLFIEARNGSLIELMTFHVNFNGSVTPQLADMRVFGRMRIEKLEVKIVNSSVGRISPLEVDLFLLIVEPFMQKAVNSQLSKGIPLPTIKDVQYIQPKLKLLDRTIQVETDLRYCPVADNIQMCFEYQAETAGA